jgi:CheY-like chemotaxis protein/CHASE3 domain sensor protein
MDTTRPTENLLVRHATVLAIASLTLLVVLAGLAFLRQADASRNAKNWVVHTYEVKNHIDLLSNALQDVQASQRGYLLTDDTDYLEPYTEALRPGTERDTASFSQHQHRSIRQELVFLRGLTADNASQQSNLDEMDEVTGKYLAYVAQTVAARRAGAGGAELVAGLHRGREMMDRINGLVHIMEAEETHLLALRSEAAELSAAQDQWMTFTSLAVFYIGMALAIWLYQRGQAKARAQLILYTQELEQREEELKIQQEELKASNEEIEAANEELEEKTRALEQQNTQIQRQSHELAQATRVAEEKTREVEQASKYKSEFLANMSHELRTPLNSLLILARLLASNEKGNLTEEQVDEARVIHNGGLELLGLINDILDLSKVEAGKLTVNAEEVAADSIIAHLQQQFDPVARDKGLAFPVVVADDAPRSLNTDSQRVQQILKNLLSNAFKFTEKGSVTLEVHRPASGTAFQRDGLDGRSAIAFSVTDTGIGIEASKFRDIFEAFQQENGSIDRHYGGTGLGLTIARKFAHMLGGEIHVESRKGSGSRFTLMLPLARRGVLDTPAPEPDDGRMALKPMPRSSVSAFIADDRGAIQARDKVLLVIEDDPAFAGILTNIARKRGYKCLAAGDGKSGLVLAVEQPVTAILLDLKLPDLDGMQVLDQLKHDLRTRHIPVHIISGRDESELAPLRKGAIGFLAKPADKEALDGVFGKIDTMLAAGAKRLLVVEDDQKTQVAIQALLKKQDLEITFAGTGEAALAHIAGTRFDCIILDLRLPDMTGFEALERMEREVRPLPPVIVYTARELSEDENRKLNRYTGSIVIKGAKSPERLLDEVTLFLHSVESTLSADQQDMIRMQHNPDKVLQGRTVLLVDDDLRNTFALSKLLRAHGMTIVIADNGQMALEKLESDKTIDLVIMDIMMPVMDGYQAMRAIRAKARFAALPIVALTARAMPEEQEKCLAAGANDYLTKPVDVERLLTLLRVWLFRQEMAA